MNRDKIKVFANLMQQRFLKSRAKHKTFHAGRGSAKTNTIGKIIYILYHTMPKARWALNGLTYVQLDLVVLSEIRAELERCRVYEYNPKTMPYGHYVIGIRPPDHWEKPYKKIGRLGYQYCMSFINGLTIQFVSQDRSETARGLNLDGSITDERASIKSDLLQKVIYPTVRANTDTKIANHYMHLGKYELGSASWTTEGMSMYANEEKYLAMIAEREKFSEADLQRIPPKFLWVESTCLDNPFTGQPYYDELQLTLDPLEFDVEVNNMRLSKLPNGYYHQFYTQKHTYIPQDCYQYDPEKKLHLYQPNDYRSDKTLDVTLDFNADIFWQLACQEVGYEFRVINSKYVKPTISNTDSIIKQGAEWFVETYKSHPYKVVYVYGDPGGNSTSASTSNVNRPFFDEYSKHLTDAGWKVFRRELISYPRHTEKYILVNYLLGEESQRTPKIKINQVAGNNKAVIIAIQSTPVEQGKEMFKKNKQSEKTSRNREFATDSTDALDYILVAKYRKLKPVTSIQKNRIIIR